MPFEKSSNWMAFEEANEQLNRFFIFFPHSHEKNINLSISEQLLQNLCFKIKSSDIGKAERHRKG